MEASQDNEDARSHIELEQELNPLAFDPVVEVFKRDIDFSIVERNLRLTTEERAQQLLNATRFIEKFRPLASGNSSESK